MSKNRKKWPLYIFISISLVVLTFIYHRDGIKKEIEIKGEIYSIFSENYLNYKPLFIEQIKGKPRSRFILDKKVGSGKLVRHYFAHDGFIRIKLVFLGEDGVVLIEDDPSLTPSSFHSEFSNDSVFTAIQAHITYKAQQAFYKRDLDGSSFLIVQGLGLDSTNYDLLSLQDSLISFVIGPEL